MRQASPLMAWSALVLAAAAAATTSWFLARALPEGRLAGAHEGPPRVVSLSPAVTETLFAIGAGEAVVGVSDYCVTPPGATPRPRVGTSLGPSYEPIVALRPSLVVTSSMPAARLDGLRALAPTRQLDWLTVNEVAASTRELGVLVGHPAAAAALAARLEATLSVPPPAGAPRLLLVLGGAQAQAEVWYVKANSIHGSAITAAGAANAVPEPVEGAPVMSLERLLAVDPDLVMVLGGGDAGAASPLDALGRLHALAAVRRGKLGALPDPGLLVPGPRVLQLVEELSRWIAAQVGTS